MILGEGGEKPIVNFPCTWKFTLIGSNPVAIEEKVKVIAEKYNFVLTPSRSSKKGKYYSFHLEVDVPTEEIKDSIHRKLESTDEIIFVL